MVVGWCKFGRQCIGDEVGIGGSVFGCGCLFYIFGGVLLLDGVGGNGGGQCECVVVIYVWVVSDGDDIVYVVFFYW